QIDFRNVVLIMTTNAGAADLAKAPMGFTRIKREGDDQEAINRLFAPEFRNRLDKIISFAPLQTDAISRVVDKFMAELDSQLADRKVSISLSDEARDWLIANGYDEAMGARPMARLIQNDIKTPLADELLFGRLKDGGHVSVILTTPEGSSIKKISFSYESGHAKPRPEKEISKAKQAKSAKAKSSDGKRKSSAGKSQPESNAGVPPKPLPAVRIVPKLPLNKPVSD
ncbi:MAG: ATP-dependent Clp protease ATP-binding subunit ClpA, partial [Methylocystaceae bacterium]|nr:ATP-dependent Clp protease ATP-binding subunit ClpA [Methylocystaceae bacterium]